MCYCTLASMLAEHVGGPSREAFPSGLGQRCCPVAPVQRRDPFVANVARTA